MTPQTDKIKDVIRYFGLSGFNLAVKSRLTNAPVELKVKIPEIKHPFFLRLKSSDIPTYKQIFVRRDYTFNVRHEPKVIIDAGANIGLASIFFANKFPNSRIISIEPEKSNFSMLQKNVTPYPNITCLSAALWYKNIEIDLIDPGLGKWGFQTKENETSAVSKPCHKVQGITIDKIMHDQQIDYIDILKIDIEGAEKEVFSEPSQWIDKVGSLIVELHENLKTGCNRSFYNATNDFNEEWIMGENIYLSKKSGILIK